MVFTGIPDGMLKFIKGKVLGKVSKAEFFTGKVNRICAIMYGNFQFFEITCRCKEFNFLGCFYHILKRGKFFGSDAG